VESDSGTPAITTQIIPCATTIRTALPQRPRDRRRARGHSFGEHGHRYRRYWGYRPEWIQIGFWGDGHRFSSNYVVDDIYTGPIYGSSGILIYASNGVTVSGNTVESTQLGMSPATDPNYGTADRTIIGPNPHWGTQNFDAIDFARTTYCGDELRSTAAPNPGARG